MMNNGNALPRMVTPGVIATSLGVPIHRVFNVLNTRRHIQPVARAGSLRLFKKEAIAQVRYELNAIDARRAGKAVERVA